jgi:tRNA(Ile)-lysidine synthase
LRLYHVAVHPLAQSFLSHIRQHELLKPGDRVGIAVSGGTDSVALLRLLLECRGDLGVVLFVVHFNHKLRGAESEADEKFVADLAHEFNLEFICDSDDVAGHARELGISLETAARELRYGFFRHLIRSGFPGNDQVKILTSGKTSPSWGTRLNKMLTGHTLDDQAETVLMRLIRGAGLRGLGGIHPRIAVEDDDNEVCGQIVRPLLGVRRRELQQYLDEIGQRWREDSTNSDDQFTRNRIRKLLVPLLETEFNPVVAESLSELANIARGEEDYWENEVSGWIGTGVHWLQPEWAASKTAGLVQIDTKISASLAESAREMGHASVPQNHRDLEARIEAASWLVMNASVDRIWFSGEPVAVQRRIVRAVGDEAGIPLEFKHVDEILRFTSEEAGTGKELSLPLGWKLVRHADELLFVTPDLRKDRPPQDYEYSLPIPGRVDVHEAGFTIEARRVLPAESAEYNRDQLLNADSVTGSLLVRNWRAGDRYWPAHTKSPKKIKELLQERHVAQPERAQWPVVVSGDEIIWMRSFPVPAKYKAEGGRTAVTIVECSLILKFST